MLEQALLYIVAGAMTIAVGSLVREHVVEAAFCLDQHALRTPPHCTHGGAGVGIDHVIAGLQGRL